MEAFVLDASVAISWCFPNDPTENTPYSRSILRQIEEDDPVVPEIWAYEIANGIFVAYSKRKRGRGNPGQTECFPIPESAAFEFQCDSSRGKP